jgi:16S rRNA processing protein RimM
MTPPGHIRLGIILKSFGYKGEVVVTTETGDLSFFSKVEAVLVGTETHHTPYFIESHVIRPDSSIVVKFEDVDDPEEASKLSGKAVFVEESHFPRDESEEFYFQEIIGYKVIDEGRGPIGTVTAVREGSMQDLLVISNGDKEVYVPLVDEFLSRIDKKRRELFLNLPEGLADLND